MTTVVLSTAGAALGSGFSGALGVSGTTLGRAAGAVLGRVIDARLLGGSRSVETPALERLALTGFAEGAPVGRVFGRMRVGGQLIWATRLQVGTAAVQGGKGSAQSAGHSYTVSLALGLGEGEIAGLGRIWADGVEIAPSLLTLRLYRGTQDQLPDPRISAVEGAQNTPAYRGLAYVVIEDFDLGAFGNRLPSFAFEVIRPSLEEDEDLAGTVRAVALIPGTGEYALSPETVRLSHGYGDQRAVNESAPRGASDFVVAMDQLQAELPRVKSVSLVVSWFGDDLRAGHCTLRPKVEQNDRDSLTHPWQAGGLTRLEAEVIPQRDGAPIYGGTPSDQSVIGAIQDIHARGQEVMFYPFLLMDQQDGNGLPDPWWGGAHQPALPWRGRITSEYGPYQAGKTDGTAAARAEVARFFGAAQVEDFEWQNGRLLYTGPAEWSLRRFILHYAHLCLAAGGVEAFCISSEMVALTQIRDDIGFPAVTQLCALVSDVRRILGPDVKLSYAADWSEYHGYQPPSGDKLFHLDPLWAHEDVDFIGIDTYMPLSDWREGEDHLDAHWGDIHNLDYLKANIAGGEGFDWYYGSDQDREAQIRAPIDDWWGEHWIWRYKDLKGWWSNPHFNRISGAPSATPTLWQPALKPIRFTELGCAAIDKGTNAPNKFLDPKSSESGLPPFSTGRRDDLIQLQYLRAYAEHFAESANNPTSPLYGGPMVEMDYAHVWTWDARPYPQFPARTDLWDDGGNYARGHWLTGRSGSRSLASVVREICAAAGLYDIDTSRLYGIVKGYAFDEGTARAALQPLVLAYGIEIAQDGARLVFSSRKGLPKEVIWPGDLVDRPQGSSTLTRQPPSEEIGRLALGYIVEGEGFEAACVEALLPDESGQTLARAELPLVLTRTEARDIAERWLAEARIGREEIQFELPLSFSHLRGGDVVHLSGIDWRIERLTLGATLEIEARRVAAETWRPHPEEADIPVPQLYAPPMPVEALLLDLPRWQLSQSPQAPHLALSARAWPQQVQVWGGAVWAQPQLLLAQAAQAVMGRLSAELTAAGSLSVDVIAGHLESTSAAAVEAGANLVAVGDGTVWELLAFETATLEATGRYSLSGLRRGLWGSQTPPLWPQGSHFVLLDSRVAQLPLDATLRSRPLRLEWGPAERPRDDSTWQSRLVTFEGVGARPYAPTSLALTASGGDSVLSWARVPRLGDWGPNLPQGHSFVVTVTKAGTVLRSWTVTQSALVYTAAEKLADGATGAMTVTLYEVAPDFGAGPSLHLAVTL